MGTMVRKQFFISRDQELRLKARAVATGRSEAELIRAGIDRELDVSSADEMAKPSLRDLSGAWAERDDLDELLRKNRQGWKRRLKRLGLPKS